MDQISRILPGDRRQPAKVHEKRAVAVDRDNFALREAEGDAERNRRREAERPRPEVAVAGPERLPLARRPAGRHDQRVARVAGDRLEIIVALHQSAPTTLRVRRTATGRRESSAKTCAPAIVASTSSGLRKT